MGTGLWEPGFQNRGAAQVALSQDYHDGARSTGNTGEYQRDAGRNYSSIGTALSPEPSKGVSVSSLLFGLLFSQLSSQPDVKVMCLSDIFKTGQLPPTLALTLVGPKRPHLSSSPSKQSSCPNQSL